MRLMCSTHPAKGLGARHRPSAGTRGVLCCQMAAREGPQKKLKLCVVVSGSIIRKPMAPGVPKRSAIQVLSGPDVAKLH